MTPKPGSIWQSEEDDRRAIVIKSEPGVLTWQFLDPDKKGGFTSGVAVGSECGDPNGLFRERFRFIGTNLDDFVRSENK
jgi:hypothetical protein